MQRPRHGFRIARNDGEVGTRRLIGLRHAYPVLHRNRFLTVEWNEALEVKDATWLTPAGEEMSPEQFYELLKAQIEDVRNGIVLRYVDNPNGSIDDIAGIANAAGNVVGLMPHPERAVDPLLGSSDGRFLLEAVLTAAAGAGSRAWGG